MKKLNSYVSGLFLALASVAAHAGNTTAERPYKSAWERVSCKYRGYKSNFGYAVRSNSSISRLERSASIIAV
ncbi:hypothetical protein NVV94_11770 [Pseudomonas sp. LS1212]|uniref:hypothetical protein n=1 Tax=Pseudomonas sp. LS1212 TaxID=2972478 RepID=UPI00215C0885|nr:hypothetical protein [Pseudomonas sp. LS1212]UVJ46152.1 hypothetical protein NVV94_11770 [Pseudomonas sp. LS1212]